MQPIQRPFDDPDDTTPQFWKKSLTNKTTFSRPKTYESQLVMKSKNTKKGHKTYTFRLIDDKFICLSVNSI